MAGPEQVKSWLGWLLTPHKKHLNIALLLAVAAAGLFVVQSWLLASLFSDWLNAWQTTAWQALDSDRQRHLLIGLLACLLVRPVLQYGRERLGQIASTRARRNLREQLLHRLASLGPARRGLGADAELSSRILEQVDALDGYISRYQVQRQLVILIPLMLLIATAFHSWLAVALFIFTAPLVPLFMILLGQAAASASQRQFVALGQLSGRFLDLLRGLRTLRHLQALDAAQSSVAEAAEDYRSRTMRVLRMAFLSGAVLELFASVAIAMVALYLGLGLMGMLPWAMGDIPVPYQGALFILLLAPEFYAPLRQLGTDYHARAEAEGAISELLPLLQLQAWQHPGDQPLQLAGPPAIVCNEISVALPGAAVRLASTTVRLAPGERVLLQGPSGSGKSTLLHALLGFVPYEGEILINGQPLRDIGRSDWHHHVGFLAQQPELVAGTLADNLLMANPQASTEQLIDALRAVELWSLVHQLPLQLDTPLGERGVGLSGGQLSRLALARLLLRDTQVWLLDEPLAHLDSQTAERIGLLLERLSRQRTLLLVSHELTGLDWVDRVVTLGESADG